MALVDSIFNKKPDYANKEQMNFILKKTGSTIYLRHPMPEAIMMLSGSAVMYYIDRTIGSRAPDIGDSFAFFLPKYENSAIAIQKAYRQMFAVLDRTRPGEYINDDAMITLYIPMKDSYHGIIFDEKMIEGVSTMAQKGATSCAIKINGLGDYIFKPHTETDGSIGMHFKLHTQTNEESEARLARQMKKIKGE